MSAEERQAFVERAGSIEWQLMSGERRQADVDSDEALADAFDVFGRGDPDVDIAEDHDFFHVHVEGYHRSIFLNTASVEWISIPTHRLKQGALSDAEGLVNETAADEAVGNRR